MLISAREKLEQMPIVLMWYQYVEKQTVHEEFKLSRLYTADCGTIIGDLATLIAFR